MNPFEVMDLIGELGLYLGGGLVFFILLTFIDSFRGRK